jgi:hypothetical protein
MWPASAETLELFPTRPPRNSAKRKSNRLGNLYYKNEDYGMAERYWRRDANSSVASRFNLGLFYSLDTVSREADAIDTWRGVLKNSPDHEPTKKSLANVYPTFSSERRRPRSFGPTLLPQKQWFHSYISPIRLFGPDAENDVCSLDAKAIQKLKKAVFWRSSSRTARSRGSMGWSSTDRGPSI